MITGNNPKTMDKYDPQKLFSDAIEKEKAQEEKKRIKQALKEYPEIRDIVIENERLLDELGESADLGEIKEQLEAEVKELRKKLNESELVRHAEQLERKLINTQNQIVAQQNDILKIKKIYEHQLSQKDDEYKKIFDEYNLARKRISELINHINSDKGLIKSWNKNEYIKQLEAQILEYKKTFKSGGRKPLSPEKIEEIHELRNLGKSKYAIAKMLQISEGTVRKYLKKA